MAEHREKNFVADNEFRKKRKLIFPIQKNSVGITRVNSVCCRDAIERAEEEKRYNDEMILCQNCRPFTRPPTAAFCSLLILFRVKMICGHFILFFAIQKIQKD